MLGCSRMAAWAGLISVRWRKVPVVPVKAPTWIRSSWRRSSGQVAAQGVLGDAGEQEGEPAQDDVGADALFLAVVDGPQVDDLIEVFLAALDFRGLRRSTSVAAVVGPGWCGPRLQGLLDADDHRVGPGKRFGVGVAEADVGHPGAAVGGGV